jgi:hypothetical protein
LALAKSFNDRIDAIADDTKDMRRSPINQGFNQNVGSIDILTRQRCRLRRNRIGTRPCGRI